MALDLPAIYASAKSLIIAPQWEDVDAHRIGFLTPLAQDGVVPQGLQLRGRALKNMADRNVIFQIEVHRTGRNLIQLARVCWMPLAPHPNRKGPPGLKGKMITDSHCHHFHLNYMVEEKKMRSGNLIVADSLSPQPKDFREAVATMGQLFNIVNADMIQPPEWQGVLV